MKTFKVNTLAAAALAAAFSGTVLIPAVIAQETDIWRDARRKATDWGKVDSSYRLNNEHPLSSLIVTEFSPASAPDYTCIVAQPSAAGTPAISCIPKAPAATKNEGPR